jgi:hypothetical protein
MRISGLAISDTMAILTGRIMTITHYERPFRVFEKVQKKVVSVNDRLTDEELRIKAQRRARKNLIMSINSNAWAYEKRTGIYYPPVFMTLTTKEPVQEYENTLQRVSKYFKRLSYRIGDRVLYSGVAELFKKTKYLHFHILMYNLPYIKQRQLQEEWGNIIDVRRMNTVVNAGRYMAKYFTKSTEIHQKGRKHFFQAQDLIKPSKTSNPSLVGEIESMVNGVKPFAYQYETKYMGMTKVYEYDVGLESRLRYELLNVFGL